MEMEDEPKMEIPDPDEVEAGDRSLFEALVTKYGVPMVTTIQSAQTDSLVQADGEPVTMGQTAVIGIVMGGLSSVALTDEPNAVIDRDNQWLVSFAVTEHTLEGIINTLIETREWMEQEREQNANVRAVDFGAGEAEGDGGVADDPESAG